MGLHFEWHGYFSDGFKYSFGGEPSLIDCPSLLVTQVHVGGIHGNDGELLADVDEGDSRSG
jgi:hypothetical protein